MDEDFKNRFINTLMRGNIEHYSDYSLKGLAGSLGYTLYKISLSPYKKFFGLISSIPPVDTLLAKVVLYNESGLLSHLEILPHYNIGREEISTAPKVCDDLRIRFSIYPEGNGFFTPTWIQATCGNKEIRPDGTRMDWDKLTNKTGRETGIYAHKWIVEGMSFPQATATQESNQEAIKKMFKMWYGSGCDHYE